MSSILSRVTNKLLRRGVLSKRVIARYLPQNPVVVEAGAYTGKDTKEMSAMWPTGVIHAFEPVPALYERLTHRVRRCANVRLYSLALAGNSGKAQIHLSAGESLSSSSLLQPKEHLSIHPRVSFGETQTIETITLDEWKRANDIHHVDFLWLDTQGTELEIMKSGAEVMKSVRAVVTEVSLKEMYANSPLYNETKDWMKSQGFSVELEVLPWEDMGNVLFVRR